MCNKLNTIHIENKLSIHFFLFLIFGSLFSLVKAQDDCGILQNAINIIGNEFAQTYNETFFNNLFNEYKQNNNITDIQSPCCVWDSVVCRNNNIYEM